jgi:hypothetical protein
MDEEFVPGPLDAQDKVKPAVMPPLHDYVLTYAGADYRHASQDAARSHLLLHGGDVRGLRRLPRRQRPHGPLVAVRGRRAELDHRRYADGRDERESGTDDGSVNMNKATRIAISKAAARAASGAPGRGGTRLDPTTEALMHRVYRLPYWEEGRTGLWHPAFPQVGMRLTAMTTFRSCFGGFSAAGSSRPTTPSSSVASGQIS